MATLQSGQTISIQLAEGESYTVTPSGTAQVSTRGVSGSELSAPRTLTSAQTFGPYTEGGVINIACLVGTALYVQAGGAVYQDPTTGALVGAGGQSALALNPALRFCIPGRDPSGASFLDVSGAGNHATIEASNTGPFTVDSRMSTVAHASAGGVSVPLSAVTCDMRTDSVVMAFAMTRANPGASEVLAAIGASGGGAANAGMYFSHRSSAAGVGRIVFNRGDGGGSLVSASDSAVAFSNAGGTQERHAVMAYDAPSGSAYLYRDGVLVASNVGLMTGASAIAAANVQGARLGGAMLGATVAGAFRGWQCYIWRGRGLPLNIGTMAALLAESPSQPVPVSALRF